MQTQLALPGMTKGSMGEARMQKSATHTWPRSNLFFALLPSPEQALGLLRRAVSLDEQLDIQGKPLRARHLHITLRLVGGYELVPPEVVAVAMARGAAVRAPPVQVVFDRVATFRGAGAFVLLVGQGCQAMRAIQQCLGPVRAEADAGRAHAFTPHMTLSYGGRAVEAQAIDPIHWTATELALIKSHVGKTHHEVLGRWLLGL